MSAPANTASTAAVNLASRVLDQEPDLLAAVAEVHEQVAGPLGDPGVGRMGGDAGEVSAAAAVLDHSVDTDRLDGAAGYEAHTYFCVFRGRPGSEWTLPTTAEGIMWTARQPPTRDVGSCLAV
jgi:hypothetical protein